MTPAQLETYQRLVLGSNYHWVLEDVDEQSNQTITFFAPVVRLFIKIYPDGTYKQYTEAHKNAMERAMI